MKKWMVIELIVLAVLLVAAIIAGAILAKPVLFPNKPAETTASTGSTEIPSESTAETIQESTGETTTETTAEPTQESTAETTEQSSTESTQAKPPAPTQAKPTEPAQDTATQTTAAGRKISARQYFVYDCSTNAFTTISGEPHDRIYPASITKLLTAYVALLYLQPEETITAGAELNMVNQESSIANIWRGDVLTVRQLIAGMLLPSGNDAAHVLACHTGRVIAQDPDLDAATAVQVFVDGMNTHAAQLGMTGSHFVNPDGMHSQDHYITFSDMVTLGKLVMENHLIMQYTGTPKTEITLHEASVVWKNTNRLIDSTSSYYCPYAVGLKTGQTSAAGNCLLSAYHVKDQHLLIGVFGTPSEAARFEDTLQLFDEWFSF